MIRQLSTQDMDFKNKFEEILNRANMDMTNLIPNVLEMLNDVKHNGEEALLRLVSKFDSWNPKDFNDLRIDLNLAQDAYKKLDSKLKDSLKMIYDRIYDFHTMTKPKGFLHYDYHNSILGVSVFPMQKAGIYVPGGKAFYPSSILMNVIPAKVAGVKEIVITTPTPKNHINELVLATLYLCGVDEAYKIGGVGAIGMLAYGIKDKDKNDIFKKVQVITGPGNIFVATAKKLVFGEVNIDMIAGPSEIGIIADKDSNVEFIAIDMLSQAEHDEMASSILITDSEELAQKVAIEIDKQCDKLKRKEIAQKSIDNRGVIITTKNLNEAVNLMNKIAPEHLEVMTNKPFDLLPKLRAAGAVFLGNYTPEAIGDYLAGPNHTLPTGGSAAFFSPLSVEHFCTKSSIISFSENGLKTLANDCALIAEIEQLEAHKLSVLKRLQN